MAPSSVADRLTQSFRSRQLAKAVALEELIRRTFRAMVDLNDIPGSSANWIDLVLPAIMSVRGRSGLAGTQYVAALRTLEAPGAPAFRVPTLSELDFDARTAARNSLWVTGPKALQDRIDTFDKVAQISEQTFDEAQAKYMKKAIDLSAKGAAGAGSRHARNGARDVIDAATTKDKTAVGWYRTTDGDPCWFCGMLAGRGALYKGESFKESNAKFDGVGEAKVHDNCNCFMRPIYSRGDFFNDNTRGYRDLWESTTKGKSGRQAIRAYRKAFNEQYSK